MKRYISIALLLVIVLFTSCRKTESVVGPTPTSLNWVFPNDVKIIGNKGYVTVNGLDRIDVIDLTTTTAGVYVVNEGGFSGGGSLSRYDIEHDLMVNDIINSTQLIRSIMFPQYTGPGFLARGIFVGSIGLLYTANYNGTVSIIDGSVDSLLSTSTQIVGFPGGIAYANGKLFVSDAGLYPTAGTSVKIVNGLNGALVDSVTVNNAPGALTVLNGKVFVLCTGTSKIYQIDAATPTLEDSIQLSGYYSDMTTDGEALYAMSSDSVTKISVGPFQVVQSALVKRTEGNYFYTLGVDNVSGDIYVSNITTAGGSGQLEIYSSAGVLKRSALPVGVFPGAIVFKR